MSQLFNPGLDMAGELRLENKKIRYHYLLLAKYLGVLPCCTPISVLSLLFGRIWPSPTHSLMLISAGGAE